MFLTFSSETFRDMYISFNATTLKTFQSVDCCKIYPLGQIAYSAHTSKTYSVNIKKWLVHLKVFSYSI